MAANFFVNRLYVLTETGKVAYDEQFHHGVNIIRGTNSSGKSTVMRLLFYALGGDYTHFVPEVRNCAKVMVEVAIGKAVITLSRPIEKDKEGRILGQRGMTIYWGSMDEVLADTCEWNTFGYKTMPTRCSFSNELFEVMDMPIVQGDNNITMYQLLRLLYIDQESPTSSLFLYDPFDKQTNRETVADLLMGIFDSDLYAAKLRQKELEVAIVDAKASLRSLESSLSPEMRSVEHISQLIEYKDQEIGKISEDITKKRQGEEIKEQKRTETDRQKAEVRRLNHECAAVEDELDMLEHEIEDSTMFISELERKKLALNHSVNTREILGSLRLEYCPECLSPLPEDVPDGTCRLCKSPIENKTGIAQAKRLISELTFQIKESKLILRNDEEKKMLLKSKLRSLHSQYKSARKVLDEMLGNVRSSMAEVIEDLIYKKGLLKGELSQYYTLLELATTYEQKVAEQKGLEVELVKTKNLIQAKMASQDQRRSKVLERMQEHGVYFLHHDQECQRAFSEASPSEFQVDFSNNIVYLQDRFAKYSASSTFFLKLVARFSLFFASLDIDWMRYPRFIFADNMEDKGIEKERAQKFQYTLIDKLKEYPADSYQLIYTTSYITDELDHSEYVVGDHYDINNKSLRNVRNDRQ